MELVLVGVDHEIQHLRPDLVPYKGAAVARFRQHALETAREARVHLIAEEFNIEACRVSGVIESVLQGVAKELGIPDLFCDPTNAERKESGIASHDDREGYWMNRLEASCADVVPFVSGDSHFESFAKFLRNRGHKAQVVSQGWKV